MGQPFYALRGRCVANAWQKYRFLVICEVSQKCCKWLIYAIYGLKRCETAQPEEKL
jgi:hypothetical protein